MAIRASGDRNCVRIGEIEFAFDSTLKVQTLFGKSSCVGQPLKAGMKRDVRDHLTSILAFEEGVRYS